MEKRSTRGKRVTELAGEDANFDQEFWNSDIWQEAESGDDSFSEEEVQPDVFDSDFNDTEDDDEDDDEGEEEDRQLKKQSRGEVVVHCVDTHTQILQLISLFVLKKM